ncbi:MAG: domain containing protein [Crocinitomicaceae bacterium]|jgi:hypothetical protein|nr:domain containing protein [Crocinitomicaceae bacterium]
MLKVLKSLLFTLILSGISAQEETSVLFIGNSFTFMNAMPSMFREIAKAKGKTIFVDSIVEGGKDLNFHSGRALTYEKIRSRKWDYIILQAHSNELAQPESKIDNLTLPYAKRIVDSIRANSNCTQLVLYMTWGYKNGNPKWAPIASYDSMQYRIKNQYLRFADLLDARVSPVGEVWKAIRANYSGINLYDPDNQHPSLVGSYLSACTHFSTIFGETPLGNHAPILLDEMTRQIIELNASQIVLNNMNQWRNVPRKTSPEAGFDLVLSNDTLQVINRARNSTWIEWDFGDGHKSVEESPSHCYLSKGAFTVTQKVMNACKTIVYPREILVK